VYAIGHLIEVGVRLQINVTARAASGSMSVSPRRYRRVIPEGCPTSLQSRVLSSLGVGCAGPVVFERLSLRDALASLSEANATTGLRAGDSVTGPLCRRTRTLLDRTSRSLCPSEGILRVEEKDLESKLKGGDTALET
jgi:hypothetical protein